MTNIVDYYGIKIFTTVKSFVIEAQGLAKKAETQSHVFYPIKRFSSLLTVQQNKLECFSMVGIPRLFKY
jgi:hypothetical protein